MNPRLVLVFLLLSAGAAAYAPPTFAASVDCVDGALCAASVRYDTGCGTNETVDGETCAYGVGATASDPTGLDAGEVRVDTNLARGHVHGQNAYNDWAQDEHTVEADSPAPVAVSSRGYASAQEPLTDAQATQADRRMEASALGQPVWVDTNARVYGESLRECRVATSLLEPATDCQALDPEDAKQRAETFIADLLP